MYSTKAQHLENTQVNLSILKLHYHIDHDPDLLGSWFFVCLALLDSCSHNLHPPLGLGHDYVAPVIAHSSFQPHGPSVPSSPLLA